MSVLIPSFLCSSLSSRDVIASNSDPPWECPLATEACGEGEVERHFG